MIVKFLSQTKLWILILIPVLTIFLWLDVLSIPELEPLPNETFQMPLYTLIYKAFGDAVLMQGSRIVAMVVLIIQAFLIIKISLTYPIYEDRRTYFPAFIFIVLCSSFFPLMRLHPIYFINIIILVIIDILFSFKKKDNVLTSILFATMLISIGSLIYLNMLFFMVFIWVALVVLRSAFNWREWMVSLFGLILPIALAQVFYVVVKNDPKDLMLTAFFNLLFDNFRLLYNTSYFIFYGYIGLLILAASIYTFLYFKHRNISARNYMVMFLWLFIITIPIFMFVPSASMELMPIAAIPVSFHISGFITDLKNKWVADGIFIVMLILIVYINFIN